MNMSNRKSAAASGIMLMFALSGCHNASQNTEYPGSFRIKEIKSEATPEGTRKTWLATIQRDGFNSAFRIELLMKTLKPNELFAFSKGAFVREPNSNNEPFLRELAKLLSAKEIPDRVATSDRLDFGFTVLGTSQSHDRDDGFSSEPAGNWMATKVFVADGEGEFFLNLNPVDSAGEISLKDEEYGDTVIKALAPVFKNKNGN